MSIVTTDDKHYKNIAQAIRGKTGGTENMTPEEMPQAIAGISGGGVVIDPTKIIEKTVSGTTICVDDVSEIPHKCAVSVDKDANVTVYGKNLASTAILVGASGITESDEVFSGTVNSFYRATKDIGFVPAEAFEEGQQYVFSVYAKKGTAESSPYMVIRYTDGTQGCTKTSDANITAVDDFVRFTPISIPGKTIQGVWFNYGAGGTDTLYIKDIQVEKGATATAYEPYNATTYHVTAGQTIEVDSICPTMTLSADNDATITFGYQQSWGMVQGKQAEYDRFWDAYQQNGNRGDYQYAFYNWDNACYNPKYPINGVIANSFRGSTITNTQVPIVATASSVNAFYGCASLVNIQSLDLSESTNLSYVFQNCAALQEIRITGNINLAVSFAYSSKLSTDSIQSIIDHLADLTGKTAQTLTLHATVGGKLTDAQKASVTAKNWTLVY